MENEIGKYLGQVADAHLSDETKFKIRCMLRQIGELESIGDSCFNLARILQRKRANNVHFGDFQWHGVLQIHELVDTAMTRMNAMLDGRKEDFTIDESAALELKINNQRNTLKQQSMTDVDNKVYSYDNGTVYMALVNEYEKVGDYVLNVVEARLGVGRGV